MSFFCKVKYPFRSLLIILLISPFAFSFCKPKAKPPAKKAFVSVPEDMDPKVRKVIQQAMNYARANNGKIDDSIVLRQPLLVDSFYSQYSYQPIWSTKENWILKTDSLFSFINQARYYGLFPEDYHVDRLRAIRTRIQNDSSADNDRKDAALWARADIMFTDAVAQIFKDIKFGRIPPDSITMRRDTNPTTGIMLERFRAAASGNPIRFVIAEMEPRHRQYHDIKLALRTFLKYADFSPAEKIKYPNKDTAQFRASIKKRLLQLKLIDSTGLQMDSSQLAEVIKRFQFENELTDDGKVGAQTVKLLNLTDSERFLRIAITLDRIKHLPDSLPQKYIWVNIPAFHLRLMESDSTRILSRIVVGKPETRTPVLNSTLYEMITYPQWTIPNSIIIKEILPALKKDPGYLAEKGYSLVQDTAVIDPYTVDWSVFKKSIPYRIIQGSGDDNALGVLKFNFGNKYAVYLHDTNQRYYFSRNSRALSHGCVRVQEWHKMAVYLLKNDSISARQRKSGSYIKMDSLRKWLANKEKRIVPVRNRIPVYIRYFTCEAANGNMVFYEDIYNEDKMIAELYFAGK